MSTVETATIGTPLIEPLDDRGTSAVRFETQCVVIPDLPDRSRRPRVVTKSYALPLWKRRTSSASSSTSAPPEDIGSEENQSQLVLRVPLPTFSRKYHPIHPVDHTPLPPCLVHRSHPSSSSCDSATSESLVQPVRPFRKTSLSPPRSDIVTIPLRPCCAACQSVTDAAILSGDAWPERFSRAASRRRSMSADGGPRTITVAGSAASASYGALGVAISVDEVDKRRRSSDTGPSTFCRDILSDDAKSKGECTIPLILCRPSADARLPPSPSTPRIPEEEDGEDGDESELFPLPSPKRTPTTSPAPSPGGSLSSFATAQSQHGSPTPSTCSGDSACSHPSKRKFLAPPAFSSSPISLPGFPESMGDLVLMEDPPSMPSPSLLSALPTLSGRHNSRPPSPRISCVPPTPADMIPSTSGSTLSTAPKALPPLPVPIPITSPSTSSRPSTSPQRSPAFSRLPWRLKQSVSSEDVSPGPSFATPSSSPALSTSPNSKMSHLMSNSRHVMQDVLRGVASMGSGGIGM